MATATDIVFSRAQLPVRTTGMQSMASKMWAPWIIMGFMVVVVALIVDLFTSSTVADYLSHTKLDRESAVRGTDLAQDKAAIESVKAWLPGFKFLGMGMLLGGVSFLLATILGALRTGGGSVQHALGAEVKLIRPPMTAKVFPMVMMMGMMVLVVAFIVGLVQANIAVDYWNHSIATRLNPAEAGSDILRDLGRIQALDTWLAPLRFVGLALVLSSIGLALATIVRVLRWQSGRILEVLDSATSTRS